MKRRKALAFLWLVALILAILWITGRARPTELRVTFLDVGQGDGIVIETPSGKVILVDSGGTGAAEGEDMGRRVVVPYLRQRGINALDVLLLTHPDSDHIGGAASILRAFPVSLFMDNGQTTGSRTLARTLRAAEERHVAYKRTARGEELDCHDGVTLSILAPTEAERQGITNDASTVVRVEYGRTAFLLTGDAEAEEESELIAASQPLACNVLKVGHHGSRFSSTPAFLDACHPQLAVVSVGRHNLYGHPSGEVLQRLHDRHIRIFRTDQSGAITCLSNGLTVQVKTMRSGAGLKP